MKPPLKLRTYGIGSPRKRGEGLRIGTVRFLPRGVLKKNYAKFDYFDVWFPALAPSRKLMAWAKPRDFEECWPEFARRYEREMLTQTDSRQALILIAKLAERTSVSVGCYCGDERHCHRSVLLDLIKRAAAGKV